MGAQTTMCVKEKHNIMAKYRTNLKALRDRAGKSRMDLVREADMSYPTVARWETEALASLDAAKVNDLCKLLGCTYDELVYIVEEETSDE